MTSNDDHFDEFDDHTLLKHAILRAYCSRWAMILLSRGAQQRVCSFFDAFAGAGRDATGRPGSPSIILNVMQAVREEAAAGRLKQGAELRAMFVEQKPKWFRQLRVSLNLSDDVPEAPSLRTFCGDCGEKIDDLLAMAENGPLLSFLDPFGVKGLDAAYYPRLLRGPRDEVFALVNGPGAARLQAVIVASTDEEYDALAQVRMTPTLFDEMNAERERVAQEALDTKARHLTLTRGPSREILMRALGSEARVIQVEGSTDYASAFVEQFIDALRSASARFVVQVPMRDQNGVYKYTLVHASKNPMAVLVMKDAIRRALNDTGVDPSILSRLQSDLSIDLEEYLRRIRVAGAGRTFRWAPQDDPKSLQARLLVLTPIFPHQMQDLKRHLVDAGLLRRVDRKDTVTFPALPS